MQTEPEYEFIANIKQRLGKQDWKGGTKKIAKYIFIFRAFSERKPICIRKPYGKRIAREKERKLIHRHTIAIIRIEYLIYTLRRLLTLFS
jgi:hypothetical protein